MAAGDRYIDCTNKPYEPIEALFKRLIRYDDAGLPYINMWASGLTPTTEIACGENRTWNDIFYELLVEDDDGDLAIASFGT